MIVKVGNFSEEGEGFAAAGGGEDESGVFACDDCFDLLGVEGMVCVDVGFLLFAGDEVFVVMVATS